MTYPITELYAWVIDDPSGEHGILVFKLDTRPGMAQAVTSNKQLAERMEGACKHTAEMFEKPVMLQRFVLAETIKRV